MAHTGKARGKHEATAVSVVPGYEDVATELIKDAGLGAPERQLLDWQSVCPVVVVVGAKSNRSDLSRPRS
ncbi:MAG TPA: hypothetical protein VK447_09525 [Myxococcaceae bacterium]|nr:hypothetical protein [Myxococcaceae bacterium]